MAINDHVYGIPGGPTQYTYVPNAELVKISLARNVTFLPKDKTEARLTRDRIIECEKDKTACSIEKRKAISMNLRSSRESITKSPSKPILISEKTETIVNIADQSPSQV